MRSTVIFAAALVATSEAATVSATAEWGRPSYGRQSQRPSFSGRPQSNNYNRGVSQFGNRSANGYNQNQSRFGQRSNSYAPARQQQSFGGRFSAPQQSFNRAPAPTRSQSFGQYGRPQQRSSFGGNQYGAQAAPQRSYQRSASTRAPQQSYNRAQPAINNPWGGRSQQQIQPNY